MHPSDFAGVHFFLIYSLANAAAFRALALLARLFHPPSRGAGGAAGGVELIPELSTMRGVLFLKNMMVVRYQWVIQVVPVGDTTSRVMHQPLIHLLIF